jgi:hypothetical protein
LKNPALEQKLIARLRSLEVKAEDVDTMIASYSIDFLPNGSRSICRPDARRGALE